MALTSNFVDNHIATWQNKLDKQFYPYRKHWPSCLFHHAPLENAIAILNDGVLKSRDACSSTRPKDVAAPDVLATRNEAHSKVRLYFRPKTPTQWNIEGIRKIGECPYGETTHAPVLIMFVLDAKKILTNPSVEFSNKNMQKMDVQTGNTEEFFSTIDFDKVYSEGGINGDRSIIEKRCAEVLLSSSLPLNEYLKGIYFRSEPEKDTLLYSLGKNRIHWEKLCFVSDALRTFQKDYTFLDHIRLNNDGIVFKLNPRRDGRDVSIKIKSVNYSGDTVFEYDCDSFSPIPPSPSLNWIYKVEIPDGDYLVEIYLENHLAYRSVITCGNALF